MQSDIVRTSCQQYLQMCLVHAPSLVKELSVGMTVITASRKDKSFYDKREAEILMMNKKSVKVKMLSGPMKGHENMFDRSKVSPAPSAEELAASSSSAAKALFGTILS